MYIKKLLWLVPLFAAAACSNGGANREYNKATADSSATVSAAAPAIATVPPNPAEHKIKRTADFHCKVQNVFSAVTTLEQLVKANSGSVQESHIENSNSEIKTAYYKPDSLRQTQTYTTTALLTLKVPSERLDSIINAIPRLTTFLESRTLTQSDVTYQYMANELKGESNTSHTTAAALRLARKSKDAIDAGQYEIGQRDQQIDRKIANLQLADDVVYATVTVAFSQPEQVFVQTIVNPEHVTRIPFYARCQAAINSGSGLISAITIALIRVWPLLLLSAAAWIIFHKMRGRKNNAALKSA